ncbi:hypothetical protein I7I48_11505 [Histoplasma ohiense]|nr:hypothetical protein I7I48_11505 [Histoplasma ohiense (nom. inval.)]
MHGSSVREHAHATRSPSNQLGMQTTCVPRPLPEANIRSELIMGCFMLAFSLLSPARCIQPPKNPALHLLRTFINNRKPLGCVLSRKC